MGTRVFGKEFQSSWRVDVKREGQRFCVLVFLGFSVIESHQ